MQTEVLDLRHLSADDALAVARLIYKVWPKPAKDELFRQQQLLALGRGYRGPENQSPRSFVIRQQGQILAHAAVIPRTIGTDQGEMTIAGLCKVCSDPDLRGQGLGEQVVRRVFELIDNQVFDFSLFQTTDPVRAFYESLGACVVENRFVNSLSSKPTQCPFWDDIRMRYPSDREWPKGEIDLRGPGY